MNTDQLENITDLLQEAASKCQKTELPKGIFKVTNTILLCDDCEISGAGVEETTLVLDDAVNNNMFTNVDYKNGNKNIIIRNLVIEGNYMNQFKPETERRLSFCNAIYLARCNDCSFYDLEIKNVLQTSLHFNRCKNITITRLYTEGLGWSGISSSGTSNIHAIDFIIYNTGNDHRHSAIHLDGGKGFFVKGKIKKCVGNGVMLDATYDDFANAVVQVEASECMRGIALIGSDKSQPQAVSINNSIVHNNDIGIMVSNANVAFIHNAQIHDNKECGLLFQGRVGGCDSFVTECTFTNNGSDIKEVHQSKNNFFFCNNFK